MALKTNKEFCQEVLYEVYGGIPPSDARPTERFVLTKVNEKIAASMMVNAYANTNIEGVTYADDIFYVSYNNIEVSADSASGYLTATLPVLPTALPSQRSITVSPSNPTTDEQETLIKMSSRANVKKLRSLPPVKKVFAFLESGKIKFYVNAAMFPLLSLTSVNLTIAAAAGAMSDAINAPADMLESIKLKLVQELRISIGIPQDIKNDGQEIKENQA